MMPHSLLATSLLLCTAATAALAQGRVVPDDNWCHDNDYSDRSHFCEVREFTLPAVRGALRVDAAPNGGIRVEAWDRNEVQVRAKVEGRADADAEAEALVHGVRIATEGTIRARGPSTRRHQYWVVSYRLMVPHRADLDLETVNGGIDVSGVTGTITFDTRNGGVHLADLAGDVRGSTMNGGVRVELSGTEWQGAGLDVQTTNGGVHVDVPSDYNARLETGTVNGGLQVDFPITVQGRLDRRRLTVTLGRGGTLVRAVTTNGGVVIRRKGGR